MRTFHEHLVCNKKLKTPQQHPTPLPPCVIFFTTYNNTIHIIKVWFYLHCKELSYPPSTLCWLFATRPQNTFPMHGTLYPYTVNTQLLHKTTTHHNPHMFYVVVFIPKLCNNVQHNKSWHFDLSLTFFQQECKKIQRRIKCTPCWNF